MKRIIFFVIIISLLIIGLILSLEKEECKKINIEENNQIEKNFGDQINVVNPSLYVATDGLGRKISTNVNKLTNHYRAVGMFYWTWHLETNNSLRVINVNNISNANPNKIHDFDWWSLNYPAGTYWWNEPIYGYYMENDDYVLRKQAELLSDAGVNFVVFDCTNRSYTWKSAYENLLKVWKAAKEQGVNVPQVAFMLPFAYSNDTYTSFMDIYNNLYNPTSENYKKYSSLLFRFNGKPLILLNSSGAPANMKNLLKNFEVRSVDATYFNNGAQSNGRWGWLSTYPQAYYKKANGQPEQISVGVAQNASYTTNKLTAMNGNNVMGRSYALNPYSYSYLYRGSSITVGDTIIGPTARSADTSMYGRNFQQQWDRAIAIDPEIVFVTGWNEWTMGRFTSWSGVANAFPDEFNDEYSRDIEPSKGKLKDYYYYQLVDNIRKYKGVTPQGANTIPITISKTSDWNNININNYNTYIGGKNRNIKGFGIEKGEQYVNTSFRNDIKQAKVSYDKSNIYFYVQTNKKLTPYTDSKWMQLLIDTVDSNVNNNNNWEEYEYIINRIKGSQSTLVLEKTSGEWNNFTEVGKVSYKVTDNILEITIPRKYLGLTSKKISFNFKWCDNNLSNGDIMSVYTDGDAAPGGRFAFHFEGISEYKEPTPTKTPKPTATPVRTTYKKGDVNGDGKVNSTDYIAIRKHILKQVELKGEKLKRANINGDKNVNSLDYIAVRKIILNNK